MDESPPQPRHTDEQTAGERLAASISEQKATEAPAQPSTRTAMRGGGINKYITIGIVLVLLIVGGIIWRTFFSAHEAVVETGVTRDITITTHANTWNFDPEEIEVDQGDRVRLTVINEDEYDHGFAIDAYGISQRMPARGTIHVEFVATRPGVFPYYCSVSCGSGIVDGEERGHFDQIGRLHIRSLISETTDFEPEKTIEELKREAQYSAMKEEAARALGIEGITATKDDITIDEDNTEWLARGETPDALADIKYQALRYADDTWIFIDTDTGEVIGVLLKE